MRSAPIVSAVVLGALLFGSSAHAEPAFCAPSDRACSRVTVPLDRSGKVPGTVPIQVERTRAAKPVRAPLFLIAGGPGQSSTRAFDRQSVRALLKGESAARDVYVIDPRGTGDSGLLRCTALEKGTTSAAAAGAACANQIGPRRAFYTARDSADDLEAVRRELGVPKIALLGVSYGTKVALAYARRYPDHVDRLVLDSVLEAEVTPDPLYRPSFAAVPRVLQTLCRAGGCDAFTHDPVHDLARLAARIERRPLKGVVVTSTGRREPVSLTGFDLFSLLLAGDLDPSLRTGFPAAVRSALTGDPAPLLRSAGAAFAAEGGSESAAAFSVGAFAAATCEESPLPWARGAPLADRPRQARAYVLGQPRSVFSPFGPTTALESDVVQLCSRWPEAAVAPEVGGAPAMRVPTLLLEGEADLRTPAEGAHAVASRLSGARVLVVPDTGHDTVDSDPAQCAPRAMRTFLATGIAPSSCPRRGLTARPTLPAPRSVRALRPSAGTSGRAGRTLTGVKDTLGDVSAQISPQVLQAIIQALSGGRLEPVRAGGLRGGSASFDLRRDRVTLRGVEYVPGLRVSGSITGFGERSKLRGTLRVTGSGAARGMLRLRRQVVSGRLAGRAVRGRADVGLDLSALSARAARVGPRGGVPIR